MAGQTEEPISIKQGDMTPEEIERKNFLSSDKARLIRQYKKAGYTNAEIKIKVKAALRAAQRG